MKSKNRPKWATNLKPETWEGLKVCQNTNRPTLKTLKADVLYQRELSPNRVLCWTCEDAMRELGIDLPATGF